MIGLRPLALIAVVLLAGIVGCTCGARSSSTSPAAGQGQLTTAPGEASPAPLSLAGFSAPIAALRAGVTDVVAGLVASVGVVRALGVVDGKVAWAVDALSSVVWAPDAELTLRPGAAGATAMVWRGVRGGRPGHTLRLIGSHGELEGEPA